MRTLYLIGVAVIAAFQSGCSTTLGSFEPNTHFVFPNSNLKPLGHVSATLTEGRVLVPPTLTKEKALKLMSDALVQKPGADMIVNYRIDTAYTLYPFYTVQTIKLEGTAAKMEVGEQDLINRMKYQ